jgi:hypothetical protein
MIQRPGLPDRRDIAQWDLGEPLPVDDSTVQQLIISSLI